MMPINYPISYIDRDDVIASMKQANVAEPEPEPDDIAELRRLVISLSAEIAAKEKELFAIQSSLAGTIQA